MYRILYVAIGILVLACCGNGMDRCCVETDPKTQELIGDGWAAGVEGGSPEDALKLFEMALKRDPNAIRALLGRGMALMAIGDFEAAHKDASRIIELCPDLREGYYLRAKIFEAQGHTIRYHLAIHSAEKAPKTFEDYGREALDRRLAENPEDAKLYLRRARSKKNRGDYEGAVKDYDEYLRLVNFKPRNDLVFLYKGTALQQLGDYQGALESFEAGRKFLLEFSPESDSAMSYLRRIAEMRREMGDIKGAEADERRLQEWNDGKKRQEMEKNRELLNSLEKELRLVGRRLALEAGEGGLSESERKAEIEEIDRWFSKTPWKIEEPLIEGYLSYQKDLVVRRKRGYNALIDSYCDFKEYDAALVIVDEYLDGYAGSDQEFAESLRDRIARRRKSHKQFAFRKWLQRKEYDKALAAVNDFVRAYPDVRPEIPESQRKVIEQQRQKDLLDNTPGPE